MRNSSLPTRASILALAVALAAGPSPAVAQSFVGSHSATGASVDQSTPGQTNVTVTQQQAVINWTATNNPAGGQIVFQPDGTIATFNGAGNYAVLNRVTPGTAGNAIYMGGSIRSLIGGEITGGTVFFYSPNGIVIGQNASINVGSLGLTTLPIADDGQGNWMSGFGSGAPQIVFGQATDPNSFVRTNAAIDGSINAFGAGSYVALVAPQVTHNGVIRTDTAAALVAAEAATITFSPSGLFNIQVTTGTDAATGIGVSGTIARNSATEGLFNHSAYLVAVAKNDAVTMVINGGGSVGFDTATSASVENNVVVLSGGYNVFGGFQFGTAGVSNVSTTITNATLSSDVDVQVTGGAAINSGDGALSFGGDLSVLSGETTTTGGNALVDGLNGNPLNIAGNLFVRAARRNADGSETGLISRLGAEGGSTVTIGGDVELNSDSFGAHANEQGENGTSVTGGNAQVNIGANSTLNVTGSIDVHADALGGFSADATAGNGTGGEALVMAINGNATITVGGSVFASADGEGGSVFECLECGVTGGDGTGGNASVHTNVGTGNRLQIAGDVWVSAIGQGGGGDVQAGSGIGGTARIGAADNSDLSVGGDTDVDATGWGGFGFDNAGGLGRGGEAGIGTGAGGSIDLTGPVFVIADGIGGDGAVGGTGTGRRAYIAAVNGTIHASSDVFVSAYSEGGFGFSLSGGASSGGGGIANTDLNDPTHTWASLYAENGTLAIDGISFVTAGALGGSGFNGGNGGNGVAGRVTVHAGNSDAGPSLVQLGDLFAAVDASGGFGGDGQSGTNGGDGGDGGSATGGRVTVTASAGNGDLVVNDAIVVASAVGGDGGFGGDGDGGNGGNAGDGGSATGGWINIGSESGAAVATGSNDGSATYASIFAFTSAFGGNGGSGGLGTIGGLVGNGGDAIGGDTTLLVRGSTVNVGNVQLDSSADGGSGGLDANDVAQGIGGDAITGSVAVLVTNRFELPGQRGTLNAATITGLALATGGSGATTGGQWTQGGGAYFEFINSEGTIDDVNLLVGADGIDPNATQTSASLFAIVEGTIDITNGLNIQTPGRISVHVDDSTPLTPTLTAGSFTVFADNFVHDETRPLPPNVGTISADSIGLGTDGDLIVDAHLVSASSLNLFASGIVDVEDASSGGDLALQAGVSIDGGDQSAAGWVSGNAPGNVALGDVDAGNFIAMLSGSGNLSLGALSAVNAIDLNAGGNVTAGAMATAAGAEIDALGNVSLASANVGGNLLVDAGGSLTAGPLSAGLIDARIGGLATINGMWSSGDVELWSNDIQIAATGGIDAGAGGSIRLVSTNATQALIGDGLTGSGYALGNAEFGRLSGGDVEIAGRGDASAAIDMLIGNLGVTGPGAGSTIEDPLGALVFATGDPDTQVAGGVIRITGDLTATGFADTNAIEFYTGRFELDAATGLLQITGAGTNLSGELYIEADRIHVAEGAILDQLAANPQYSGYQEDLNAPADVQRPDGVIRAGGIDVFPAEAVLVQNTGTAGTPAGFLTFGEGPLFSQSEPPIGPIELIINGQLLTEGGTLTGVDVRDLLIDETNLTLFTENSTINGCLLTGSCTGGGGGEEPPFPPDFTPTPGIQDEITLIDDEMLPPPEFGNEDFIDDNDEETEDGATSPIEPPTPLFDTSELSDSGGTVAPEVGTPMRSSPGLTDTGDVDDPVSGSGNPSLIETRPPPPTKEEKQP